MRLALFCLLFACVLGSSALAGSELPVVVIDGMNAYQKDGPKAALAAWLKGSPIVGDESADALERTLEDVRFNCGKMIGFELMHRVVFSPSSQRFYFLLKFEKGPGYIALDCYESAAGWIIPIVGFNLRPERVLPEALFEHK